MNSGNHSIRDACAPSRDPLSLSDSVYVVFAIRPVGFVPPVWTMITVYHINNYVVKKYFSAKNSVVDHAFISNPVDKTCSHSLLFFLGPRWFFLHTKRGI